jgi:hypothetical protein
MFHLSHQLSAFAGGDWGIAKKKTQWTLNSWSYDYEVKLRRLVGGACGMSVLHK